MIRWLKLNAEVTSHLLRHLNLVTVTAVLVSSFFCVLRYGFDFY